MSTAIKMRHVIWGNINLNLEDWIEDLKEDYPDLSDDGLEEKMHEINNSYLEDERANLDIQLSQPILVIADIGRWNGRFQGYKEIKSGKINDCFHSEADMCEWFIDETGDFQAKAIHHDGTNYYIYRVYKDDVSDEQKDDLKEKIFEGTVTRDDIEEITDCLGDVIAEVYGFSTPWNE